MSFLPDGQQKYLLGKPPSTWRLKGHQMVDIEITSTKSEISKMKQSL